MAQMSLENWQLYNAAHELWKQGRFQESEKVLLELKKDGLHRVSKVLLLEAYIKRSMGAVIAEIELLEALEASGCQDEPGILPTVYSMLGQAYSIIGRADMAVESFLCSVKHEDDPNQKLVEYSNAVFAAAALSGTDRAFWLELYHGYEDLLEQTGIQHLRRRHLLHDKLRIGYISCDYRQHPVASLLWPLVDRADRKNFVIYCYVGNMTVDSITERFEQSADVWRQIGAMAHREIAKLIIEDEIDILVDLGGHTSGNMLPVLAYKPAPIQISAIGWVGSTGMHAVDYVLGDEFCAPDEFQDAYVERLLSVKGSHFCFHIFKDMPQVEELPFLKNGYITFGCFNNFSKVTDEMLVSWGMILQKVPKSKLLLKHKLFDAAEGREYTLNRLKDCGIKPECVELRRFSLDYLKQYGDMDIALDTFPYTGGMTTFEAMYMGVPVISLYGESRGQRFGYSMLANAGLSMLACNNIEEYVNVAVELAENATMLADLRKSLRCMVEKSFLMDEAFYVKEVEKAFKKII